MQIDPQTALQALMTLFNAVLVPVIFSGTRKLFNIERRLSHIEGKLGIQERET